METLFIPTEHDFKKWVKDAVKEYVQEHLQMAASKVTKNDGFITRKEIAKILRVSLVTLNDWIKRGCRHIRRKGWIYLDKKEVLDNIREKKMRQLKIGYKLFHVKQQTG